MTSDTVDYIKTYFVHSMLTNIHGEPTYSNLKTLKDQLKANASLISSDLGVGNRGHLGLVLTDVEYDIISPRNPYIRPLHPGILNIPINATQHAAIRLWDDHKEDIRLFRETVNIENSL